MPIMMTHRIAKKVLHTARRAFAGAPVVFHHVPKCAGSSLSRTLRGKYLLSCLTLSPKESGGMAKTLFPGSQDSAISADEYSFREQLLLYKLFGDVACIQGHFRFSEKAYSRFHNRYAFVTLLRDPVQQFISWYFYNKNAKIDKWQINGSLRDFLKTENARFYGNVLPFYFSDLPIGSDFSSEIAIKQAQRNIQKLHVVGFLDDLPAFEKNLAARLRVRISIPHENKAVVGRDVTSSVLTTDDINRIENLCAPSIQVYNHARQVFALDATRTEATDTSSPLMASTSLARGGQRGMAWFSRT